LDILQVRPDKLSVLPSLFTNCILPEDRSFFSDLLRNAAARRQPVRWAGRLIVECKTKSVQIDLSPPPSGDHRKIWTGVLQDLTDINDLQDRFESVLHAARAYTWHRDMRSGQSQFGRLWPQFAKHDDGETSLLSNDWPAKVHPDDVSQIHAQVQALEQGEVDHHVLLYRHLLEDGSWAWLRVHAGVSERDKSGTPTALSGVGFDVTAEVEDRVRFEVENQALRDKILNTKAALERTAYEITENIPIGTYTMILTPGAELATFGFLSRKFLEITGLDEEEARSEPLRAFSCVHPDDYDDWVRVITYAFFHKLPFREEARLLVKGQVRWIVSESRPRERDDGTWVWEGFIQDITSQKISEQVLSRINKEILEIERKKARFKERERIMQDIHDGFGNQLAVVKLRLRRRSASIEQAVEIIDDCLADLRLLFDSLDAKTEAESLHNTLVVLLKRLKARAQPLATILEPNIEAVSDIHLPPHDMLRVIRIVQEAVTNALRHASASVISTTVCIQNNRRLVEVKDDGKGFDVRQTAKGRGLNNMLTRAEQRGWQLYISSDSSGTSITLDLGQA
jgi:PAS domain S-box-containing protein